MGRRDQSSVYIPRASRQKLIRVPVPMASRLFSIIAFFALLVLALPSFAAGKETPVPDYQFEHAAPTHAVTLREAIDVALRNYPLIAEKQFKLRAAKGGVTLAKMQYLPNLNVDIQESAVTPNTIASVVMNNVSGFDTVPVDSGPYQSRTILSSQEPIIFKVSTSTGF